MFPSKLRRRFCGERAASSVNACSSHATTKCISCPTIAGSSNTPHWKIANKLSCQLRSNSVIEYQCQCCVIPGHNRQFKCFPGADAANPQRNGTETPESELGFNAAAAKPAPNTAAAAMRIRWPRYAICGQEIALQPQVRATIKKG